MADDGGVLGNLPRSRPGQRSEKRKPGGAAKPAPKSRAPKPAPKLRAAKPAPKSRATKPAPGAARAGGGARRRQADESASAGSPVGDVLRLAGGIAGTGARVTVAVGREVLRRLPRP